MNDILSKKTLHRWFKKGKSISVPMFQARVQAGFPSPAQDCVGNTLDLNELCIKHPSATYFVRCDGAVSYTHRTLPTKRIV